MNILFKIKIIVTFFVVLVLMPLALLGQNNLENNLENNVKIIVIVCDWDKNGNLYLIYNKCKLFSNFEEIFNLS